MITHANRKTKNNSKSSLGNYWLLVSSQSLYLTQAYDERSPLPMPMPCPNMHGEVQVQHQGREWTCCGLVLDIFNRNFSIRKWENSYSYRKFSIRHVQWGPMDMLILTPVGSTDLSSETVSLQGWVTSNLGCSNFHPWKSINFLTSP